MSRTSSADTFGHYRLDEEIGRGGMGVVFRAYDMRTNRVVAIKRMPRNLVTDQDFRTLFRRESAMAAKLREPHIVPIHDFGEIEGQLYIDMRFVDGLDLATLLKRGPLTPTRAVDIISQIADGLDAAHAEGLVHRDVKPSNVLLVGRSDAVSERGFAYLADFGIAANLGSSTFSRPGLALGTAAYMAPERMAGDPWDHRVDVYSLACMLFEAITGRRPFPSDDLLQALQSHLHRPPPKPSEEVAGLPVGFDDVIARGMAKNAPDRYDSPGELAAAARVLIEAPARPLQVEPTIRLDDAATAFMPPAPPRQQVRQQVRPTAVLPGAPPAPSEPVAAPRPRRERSRTSPLLIITGAVLTALILASSLALVLGLQESTAPLTLVTTLPTGASPAEVGLSPDGTRAYVSNLDAGTVSVLDTATGRPVVAPIPVGPQPNSIVVSGDGSRVYVSSTGPGTVAIIDTATDTVAATVVIGGFVDGIALSRDGSKLYAADANTGTVATVDTSGPPATARLIGARTKVGDQPYGMVLNRDSTRLYVPNFGSNDVSVIDTATGRVIDKVDVGVGPVGVALSPDGAHLYVADQTDGSVTVVATATNTAGAPTAVGKSPVGIATNRDGTQVYVADRDGNAVYVLGTADGAVSAPVSVRAGPVAISVAADGRIFVVGQGSANISVLRPSGP